MNGIAISTIAERRGLVTTIIAMAPMNSTTFLSAIEAEVPTAVLIWVVSAASRETSSPVRAVSKKADDSVRMCANTASRRSATTRSPSVVTR
jgi:hypothetical protein